MECLAFTGGGTAGHIFPGLAIAKELRQQGYTGRIIWLGSTKKSDKSIVEEAGIEYIALPAGKLRRRITVQNFFDFFKVALGYCTALFVLKKEKPAIVFSKGGYVSVAPCLAARSLGIPYFTHESDLSPGLATRIVAGGAKNIFISYNKTKEYLPAKLLPKVIVSGNPIRVMAGIAANARKNLEISSNFPLILFLGGSQGASQINDLVISLLPSLSTVAFVLHQHGPSLIAGLPQKNYLGKSFFHEELFDYMIAADILVSRSGANTLWEGASLAKAMILIPLAGSGTRGDQLENAVFFSRQGAAIMLSGANVTSTILGDNIKTLLQNKEERLRMGNKAKSLLQENMAAGLTATQCIATHILSYSSAVLPNKNLHDRNRGQ